MDFQKTGNLMKEKLLPEIQASNKLLVLFRVFTLEISEKPLPAAHHLDKSVTGVVVLNIFRKMPGETVDAFGEKGDLHLVGTRIVLADLVFGNDFFFLRLC